MTKSFTRTMALNCFSKFKLLATEHAYKAFWALSLCGAQETASSSASKNVLLSYSAVPLVALKEACFGHRGNGLARAQI